MRKVLGLAGFLAFFLAITLHGQAVNGSFTGRVLDPSKSVVVGAQVTAINLDTNVHYNGVTNGSGIYYITEIIPGAYRIEVEKTGFKTDIQTGITLHLQETIQINFDMQLGASAESVTVEGNALTPNTTDATVGMVVDRQFVGNMPLNGRTFQSLIALVPGVTISATSTDSAGQFSVNGQRPDSNYFTIDGVSANVGIGTAQLGGAGGGSGVGTTASGAYNDLISVDEVQEFRIQTSTFAPEFGRTPGGQISFSTRAGSNTFHGDAFDYLRNTAFDANDWFANEDRLPRQAEHQNDFGGFLGGPIIKDKLFFFGGYEGLRLTIPSVVEDYVPNATLLNDVASSNPALLPYFKAYPQDNQCPLLPVANAVEDPHGYFGRFCGAYSNPTSLNSESLRVDYNLNNKMNFFARYKYTTSYLASISGTATQLETTHSNVQTGTAAFIYTISSNVVNDLRFNYTSVAVPITDQLVPLGGNTPLTTAAAFSGALGDSPVPYDPSNTLVAIYPVDGLSLWGVGGNANNQTSQKQFVDNLSVTKGAHSLKLGADFRILNPTSALRSNEFLYLFTEQNGPLDMGTGRFVATENLSKPFARFDFHNLSFYAQDTWRATSRLTVTYGLRWDYNPPPSSTNELYPLAFSQVNNPSTTTVLPIGSPIYQAQWAAFSPRIGVAYQLSQDPKWSRVIRAGWGVFYDTTGDIATLLTPPGGGRVVIVNNAGSLFPETNPSVLAPLGINKNPAGPFSGPTGVNPNLRLPYTYEMNVAVEQQLGKNQSFTATYVGALGRNLFNAYNYETANATLPSGFVAAGNAATSNYNSLQLLFQRNLQHGLQAMVSYTWSHSIDDASTVNYESGYGTIATPSGASNTIYNLKMDRGPSSFDIRSSLQLGVTYEFPRVHSNLFINQIVNHWSTDFIFRARSAMPVDLTTMTSLETPDGEWLYPVRPDLVPGQPVKLYGTACINAARAMGLNGCPGGWILNPAAFALQPGLGPNSNDPSYQNVARQGTLGRNAIRGFGFNELDMTLRRDFPIYGRLVLQFRADAFNLLNHPAFDLIGGNSLTFGEPGFGVATQMLNHGLSNTGTQGFNPLYQVGGPRSLQLSLKLNF